MAYSDFTSLERARQELGVTLQEQVELFAEVVEVAPSAHLRETLRYNVPIALASNTEKARSELIIAPILVEARKQLNLAFSFFSGVDFTIDAARGLNGFCDFILSSGREQLLLQAPVLMLVEAKKEDLKAGLGQCVAEMYAAQIFNQRKGIAREYVYGVVTSGTNWQFLRLKGNVVEIDLTEYYLVQVEKFLGLIALAV